MQNYLVFQPVLRYFQKIANNNYFSVWKLKVLSDESIKPATLCNISLAPALSYLNTNLQVKFDGSYLKQDKVTFTHNEVVNIYIVYLYCLLYCSYLLLVRILC